MKNELDLAVFGWVWMPDWFGFGWMGLDSAFCRVLSGRVGWDGPWGGVGWAGPWIWLDGVWIWWGSSLRCRWGGEFWISAANFW